MFSMLGLWLFVIDPDAGRSPSNPNENRTAQEDVEKALMNWGRYSVVLDPLTADLVISVRRAHGKAVTPTIGGIPNERPVIVEPIDSGIRVGGEHGTCPCDCQCAATRPSSSGRNRTIGGYVCPISRTGGLSARQSCGLALHRQRGSELALGPRSGPISGSD